MLPDPFWWPSTRSLQSLKKAAHVEEEDPEYFKRHRAYQPRSGGGCSASVLLNTGPWQLDS
eukprot:1149577-Pelagomonas_calceolata.AAC.3